jgi:hypothetical protein
MEPDDLLNSIFTTSGTLTMKPNPLIATPIGHDSVWANYFVSILQLTPEKGGYSKDGGPPDLLPMANSLITLGRTNLMRVFLDGEWSHLFFIDSDVGFTPEEFNRVLNSGYDIAAAPYPHRRVKLFAGPDGKRIQGFPIDPNWIGEVQPDGFAPCKNVATGFTCIKRSVFEKLLAEGFHINEIFDTHRDDEIDMIYSEDIAFCMRAREIGFYPYIDTTANLNHMGTHEFVSKFPDWMKLKETDNAKS